MHFCSADSWLELVKKISMALELRSPIFDQFFNTPDTSIAYTSAL